MNVLTDPIKKDIHLVYRRISLNAIWLMISRLASQSLGILFTMLVARSLGVESFGNLSYILTLVFLANILTTFGTDTYLIRERSKDLRGSHQIIAPILWLQLIISFGAVMILWISAGYLLHGDRNAMDALRIYSLALLPLALYSVASANLRGAERMDRFLILTLVISGMQIAAGLMLYRLNSSLPAWTTLLLVVQAAGAVLAVGLGIHRTSDLISWRPTLAALTDIIKVCWPIALVGVVSMLYQRVEIFILDNIGTKDMLGQYAAASRVVDSIKILHISFFGAMFPAMARAASASILKTEPSFPRPGIEGKPYLLLLGIVLVLCFTITIFARSLVGLIFGAVFLPASPILMLIIWILIPYSITTMLSLRLVIMKEEKVVLGTNLITLLITSLVSIVLITKIGVLGAGIGALAGECLLACLLAWLWKGRSTLGITANR